MTGTVGSLTFRGMDAIVTQDAEAALNMRALQPTYTPYAMRHGDKWDIPLTIEPSVSVNRWGFVLLEKPLKFANPSDQYEPLTPVEGGDFARALG